MTANVEAYPADVAKATLAEFAGVGGRLKVIQHLLTVAGIDIYTETHHKGVRQITKCYQILIAAKLFV